MRSRIELSPFLRISYLLLKQILIELKCPLVLLTVEIIFGYITTDISK